MSSKHFTQIGKYQVLDQLGEGAMGVVYRALDPVLNRAVAVKVMTDAIAHDDELRSRFLREAQAAGSLQHPNVVTIFDFGDVEGHPYIAMELVEGTDLERLLLQKVPLTLGEKLGVVIDVLNGLAYAHKRGIVHRDIKPANIRVDTEGRARIMDFGIAHLSSQSITRTGVMMGTPNYMAPEQVTGGPMSAATDIFAVGAVLYELLTGARPFQADTLHGVLFKVVSEMPPDISEMQPGLPPALAAIVRHALAKDPLQRYSTASDMANDLTQVRAALSSPPHGSTQLSLRASIESALVERATAEMRVQRRRRWALMAAAVVGVAALVGGATFFVKRAGARAAGASGSTVQLAGSTAHARPAGATTQTAAAGTTTAAPAAKDEPSRGDAPYRATEMERKMYTSLQYSADFARGQAELLSAPYRAILDGDELRQQSRRYAQADRLDSANLRLGQAIARWQAGIDEARRLARAKQSRPSEQAPQRVAAAPGTTSTSTPTQAPLPTSQPPAEQRVETPAVSAPAPSLASSPASVSVPPPQPAAAPVSNPREEIETLVAAYAAAMETRDVATLRRAYPGMTSDQQRGFEQFFRSTRSLDAKLSANPIDVNGPSAEAHVQGTYVYVTSSGSTERQPVSFRMTFRRENGVWRMASVR